MAGQEKPKPQELEKWYFTKDQLQASPSRRCGLDADKELAYRQQAANLIQDMGQRLQVSQLCINTAIVYMHRFYAFHSFTQFHRNAIASAALFLAAKVEEQPRKLEYVIKVAHVCLHRGESVATITNEQFQEQAQDLVFNENVLLQTLGFDVAIDHPHTHVVRTCHLVKAPKDLAQTSYFMASNSLHLTTMCLQYRPTVVACFCIHLASKWSNWAIPQSNEGRHWFQYVDNSVSVDLLEKLTAEFLHIFDKCPSRLKRKMMTMSKDNGSSHHSSSQPGSSQSSTPFDKRHVAPASDPDFDKAFDREYEREKRRQPAPGGYIPAPTAQPPPPNQPTKIDYNAYREKREKEERERRLAQARRPPQQPPPHNRPPNAHHKASTHHQWPPHHKPPHHKVPHEKIPHDKMPHDKIPHDKMSQHEKVPHEKIQMPHDKVLHDKLAHEKMLHEKLHHNKVQHEKMMHDKLHEKPHDKVLSDKLDREKHEHRHHRPVVPPGPSSSFIPQQEVPQRTRPPSLFSPENVTTPTAAASASTVPRRPQLPPQRPRPEARPSNTMPSLTHQISEPKIPSPAKKRPEPSALIKEMQPPTIVSPFSSPPFAQKPRQRAPSNSEPELVPVIKKLDETPGYENVIKDSQRGTIKPRQPEIKREPSLPIRSLNGIETDPTLVSNLLKESLAKPVPITVPQEKKPIIEKEIKREPVPEVITNPVVPEPIAIPTLSVTTEETEHKHKKEKKKKEKHKHKDRDKSKEERKKHKKDKDRKRESPPPAPADPDGLKITIPRDKLSSSSPGLKIKIPKERLAAPPPPPQTSGLKIKISKEVLETSRKRPQLPEPGPPQKIQRQNGGPQHHKVEPHPSNGHQAGK